LALPSAYTDITLSSLSQFRFCVSDKRRPLFWRDGSTRQGSLPEKFRRAVKETRQMGDSHHWPSVGDVVPCDWRRVQGCWTSWGFLGVLCQDWPHNRICLNLLELCCRFVGTQG